MDQIISAERDDSQSTAVGAWKRETAKPGERRNTEVWHVPHEFAPSRPLCGASLSGKLKRTKGSPNCNTCLARSGQHVDHYYYPTLRALALDQPVPPYQDRYRNHDPLYECDLVADKDGRMVLTSRGKLVAADILAPVGWLDKRTGVYHARNALQHYTRCYMGCSGDWGSWNDAFKAFRMLMAEGSKHRNRVVTCVRCATYVPPRDAL